MKKLFPLFLILVLAHCKQKESPSPLNMQGSYSTKIPRTGYDGSRNTFDQEEQFKIYTDHHMIYVYPQLTDSLAVYGIGTYKIEDNKVIENIFYSSSNGARKDTFTLKIDKSNKGYRQMIEFISTHNTKYLLTEDYKSVGKAVTSPLDGAWKQIKNLHIRENGDTVINKNITQFKLYQSGNFIWVNTYSNMAAHGSRSHFGYGTFELNDNINLKEVNINSTYASLHNTPLNIELKFLGKDVYQQTSLLENNNKLVEIYQRL